MVFLTKYINEKIKNLLRNINIVYSQARGELDSTLRSFIGNFKDKDDIHRRQVENGEWTVDQYQWWIRGQVFQGRQWMTKRDQMARILSNSSNIAMSMINDDRVSVFAESSNFEAYKLEHGAKANLNFTIFNKNAVDRLISEDPQILPKWKIDEEKDYKWNGKVVNSTITQGILQGKKLTDIADELANKLESNNKNKMLTFARTGMTQAQSAGVLERLNELQREGISVHKEWLATLDEHTRVNHRRLDGQKQPLNNAFTVDGIKINYPGDPDAPASMVFNCRCTLDGDIDDELPAEYQRRDNIDGELIENMTYDEWYKTRCQTHKIASKVLDAAHAAEKYATRDLKIASSLGRGHLEGLNFRFKSRSSLERKIIEKSVKKGMSQNEYALQITDALRYTNLSEPEYLVDDFFKMKKSLESKGYSMVEITNTLGDRDEPYRGINTLVQTPNGYTIELQFHTPQSLEIKEINHKLYEKQRLASTTEEEKKKLEKQMIKNARPIKTPVHIKRIVNKLLDSPVKQW